ncbi:hypothetical protein NW765_012005 [Fusarium oxysporum]|nr:hypothetical protein NW765_012005 [Fusarium oxysporum]
MAEFANFDGTPSSLGSETSKRKAAILDRHLPDGYSAEPDVAFGPANPSASGSASNDNDTTGDPIESSLLLQGGDMHRDMFKIKARANSLRRAATFSHHTPPPSLPKTN